MRTLSSTLHTARNALANAKAWLLFVEIPRKAGGYFRMVANPRHTTGDGKVWQAASFTVELPSESLEGSRGSMTVTLPNVSRLAMAEVEVNNEILGQDVTCWLQHESALTTFSPALSWKQVATKVVATERELAITCEAPSGLLKVPTRRFEKKRWPLLVPRAGVAL